MPNIEAFLGVKVAGQPVYDPNGLEVTFISNATGLPQVWALKRGEGEPRQVLKTEERIMFVKYLNHSSKRLFGMDKGVNERGQFYLLHESGEVEELVVSPDHIHRYGCCSPDGKWIAWSSNRRESAFFDVYIQHIETKEFRLVYKNDGTYGAVAWHPNGEQLLIQKTTTNLDHDLGLLSLETGEVDWLTKHDGEASFQSPQFSKDGTQLYVLTNLGVEFVGLASLNLQTRNWTWLDQPDWDLEELTINSRKDLLAYTVNTGGVSKGRLYDLIKQESRQWDTPQGTLSELSFAPDKEALGYVLNGASHPTDIWELDLDSLDSKRLTFVSDSPEVQEHLIEPELIHFNAFDGLEVPAFYYKPKTVSSDQKLPVVVFVHGGPESQIRSVYNPFLQYFISRGYAVCTPNVRGSSGYGKKYIHLDDVRKRMDSVQDLTALVDWLATDGGADRSRIAVMGRSYGGFMVLAAITHYPDIWAAAIDIVGISSFRSFLNNTSVWRRKLREAEYGSVENDGDFFDKIDPIHRTDAIQSPLLVLHGANDPRVPIEETEQMVQALQARNHPVEYIRFEDEGHFFVKTQNNVTAYTAVANFLDQYVGSI
ncbi:S9 family peptidase [Pullulanibacillus sp. KACC 23026]|uniref:S9 family peptidase n=1 Tax=Pullulanibacillus sp. KACC 23026 TaxID=3028315 RepID=UPI0023B1597A|nr:S9 family peptidase [Pullulanibacillus sp. KACC 23026]WEG14668.1 S9 family peptidase [Pullulanibacillus sp. KACC 23026]